MTTSQSKLILYLSPFLFILSVLVSTNAPAAEADQIDKLQQIIAQQQKMIEAQSKTLESLSEEVENIKTATQSNSEAVAKVATSAKKVSSGNDDVSLTVSGQVNRVILLADDGKQSKFFQADNDNSSSRVRWVAKAKLDDEYSAGALVEVQFESNSTADITIDQNSATGTNSFTERHITAWLDSKTLGRVWVGQGDTASNGTSEVDLSGTTVVAYSGTSDLAGGLSFKNANTGASLATIGESYSNLDGRSRDDRIRYDTPTYNGFKASTSFTDGESADFALRYSGDFRQVNSKFAAAVAYATGGHQNDNTNVNGSLSVLHDSGMNLTLGTGTREIDATSRDPNFQYVKIGYLFEPFKIGTTAIAADYGFAEDVTTANDEFTTFGLFAVQNIDKLSSEIYVGYRNHQLDRPGVSVDDINVGAVGMRIKF